MVRLTPILANPSLWKEVCFQYTWKLEKTHSRAWLVLMWLRGINLRKPFSPGCFAYMYKSIHTKCPELLLHSSCFSALVDALALYFIFHQ